MTRVMGELEALAGPVRARGLARVRAGPAQRRPGARAAGPDRRGRTRPGAAARGVHLDPALGPHGAGAGPAAAGVGLGHGPCRCVRPRRGGRAGRGPARPRARACRSCSTAGPGAASRHCSSSSPREACGGARPVRPAWSWRPRRTASAGRTWWCGGRPTRNPSTPPNGPPPCRPDRDCRPDRGGAPIVRAGTT